MNLKGFLKQNFVLFLIGYDHALHIQFTWDKKKKKNDPTIERGKIGHGTTNSKPF